MTSNCCFTKKCSNFFLIFHGGVNNTSQNADNFYGFPGIFRRKAFLSCCCSLSQPAADYALPDLNLGKGYIVRGTNT